MDAWIPDHPARPRPEWLIDLDGSHDERLGLLKTGKEAEVFLIERRAGDRSCLLAHKRYRPRSVRKGELEALGFQRASTFRNDHAYRDGRRFAKSRDQRAADRKTGYGRQLLSARWEGHEYDVMRAVWEAGADVPYPVGMQGDGLLMEYVGDAAGAAPRLADARIGRADAAGVFDRLLDEVRTIVRAGYVHADLSAYNVLVWEGRLRIIDFPQAVDISTSPHAPEFLRRDLANLCRFFAGRGDVRDPDVLLAGVLDDAFGGW